MLFTPGFLTMLALVILMIKLRKDTLRKLLGFEIPLDIAATLFFMWLLAGTYSGMMAAIVAGLGFSVVLMLTKKLIGYKELKWQNDSNHLLPSLKWVDRPGVLAGKGHPETMRDLRW